MVSVAGIDEAGRGCVIGPLVVAGVLFDQDKIDMLQEIGVKDSKRLTPKKREKLATEIRNLAVDTSFFELSPSTIDKVVERAQKLKKLNYLEAMAMAKVIRELNPDKAFVDPADVVCNRFKEQILRVLPWRIEIISEKKADMKYPVVSAASILAKVRRDEIISRLRKIHGEIGSGYPSDWRTIKFLKSLIVENDIPRDFIRFSWSTIKQLQQSIQK